MTIFSQCCEVETFLAKCARQLGRKARKLEEEVIVVSFSAFLGGSRAIGKYSTYRSGTGTVPVPISMIWMPKKSVEGSSNMLQMPGSG